MNIARRALKGIAWSYASYIWQRLLTLATTIILARVLVPEDFGLVAFAAIIISFIDAIRGFGINDALIYTNEEVDEAAETAFVINIALGILQFLIVYFLAPAASIFFEDARIVNVLRVLSLVFILDGFGKTHTALLEKDLLFRSSVLPKVVATGIKGVVSVVLALLGFGVWSIIIGQIVGSFTRTVGYWIVLRWIPKFRFSITRASALWDYGVHILIFTMLNILLELADQMLIGTMLGLDQLGYYDIGARIPELLIANFSLILTQALFPTFSKISESMEMLKAGFLATTKYTSFITVPMGIGLASVAPELVPALFGKQWEPAIILLQVLALLGMVATLQWSAGDVLKAIGRPDISVKLLISEAIYTFPLIYWFMVSTRLAVMAAIANLLAITIGAIVRIIVISRMLNIELRVFYNIFRAPFVSAGIMGLAVYGCRYMMNGYELPLLLVLVVSIFVGIVVYAVMMWLIAREELLNLISTAKELMQKDSDDDEDDDHNENEEESTEDTVDHSQP